MRKLIAVGLTAIVLGLTPRLAGAQSVIYNAYFTLTGFKQTKNGGVAAVRVTNKDLLRALNATGNFDFASGARILLWSTDDELPVIVVRQGTARHATDTEVGDYFTLSDSGAEVHSANNLTSWANWIFDFGNGQGTEFNLSGITTLTRGRLRQPGGGWLARTAQATSKISGPGALNGGNCVLQGIVYVMQPVVVAQ